VLRLAVSEGLNRVSHSSPEDGNRARYQNVFSQKPSNLACAPLSFNASGRT
jgi:hypothetical protein